MYCNLLWKFINNLYSTDLCTSKKKMNNFQILEKINYGKDGVVKEIIHNTKQSTNTKKQKITPKLAVKIIPINNNIYKIKKEIKIMKMLNHSNIVSYYDSYYDDMYYYIIMELISGKELFYHINEIGKFQENEAIKIIKKLMNILQYLHSKNIIHHDIKPENIMCPDPTNLSNLILIDFGLSEKISKADSTITKSKGTLHYMSPEVLNFLPHDKSIDIYACGIIFYILLYGYPPFNSNNDDTEVIKNKIRYTDPDFDENIKINISIINLIKQMIHKIPENRSSIEEVIDILDNK